MILTTYSVSVPAYQVHNLKNRPGLNKQNLEWLASAANNCKWHGALRTATSFPSVPMIPSSACRQKLITMTRPKLMYLLFYEREYACLVHKPASMIYRWKFPLWILFFFSGMPIKGSNIELNPLQEPNEHHQDMSCPMMYLCIWWAAWALWVFKDLYFLQHDISKWLRH